MEFLVELKPREMIDDAKMDEVAAQGVRAISVPVGFIETSSKEILKERAAALSARGIKAQTTHPRFGQYNSDNSFVNQYAAKRGLYLEQLKELFARLAILGIETATLHTGGACLEASPEWALELYAESVRAILPAAADSGVILAIENGRYSIPLQWDGGTGLDGEPDLETGMRYDDIGKLCKLIDNLASPYVKGCFDVAHAHYLGDIEKDHNMMGERIILYHINDNSRDGDMHLPPGYGTLDWELFGGLIHSNKSKFYAYIEASPWMRGSYGHMIRETGALLSGGRRGEIRRCIKCGYSILHDDKGEFCGCA